MLRNWHACSAILKYNIYVIFLIYSFNRLEIVVEPWLEGLYPALQRFLGVTGAGEMTLTESISKCNISGTLKTVAEMRRSKNKKIALHDENDSTHSTVSANIDAVAKDQTRNSNSDESSDSRFSNSDSGFLDGTQTITSDADSDYVHNSNIESLSDVTVNLEPVTISVKSDSLLEKQCEKDTSSPSVVVNGSLYETTVVFSVEQTKTGKYVDPTAGQKWSETPCIAISVLDAPSELPSLKHSRPPLSEQVLTVPALPPPYLSAIFGGDPVEVSWLSFWIYGRFHIVFSLTSVSSDIMT